MPRRQVNPTRHPRGRPRRGATLLGIGLASALAAGACTGSGTGPRDCLKVEDSDRCLPTAAASHRVDLVAPAFADPTSITNPLFPISKLAQVIQPGSVEGHRFRAEVTLLADAKVIKWKGQDVRTLVSQYVAYRDGRIDEVALDWYAQADDGSVWYFGEDVWNYTDGVVADRVGTWIAGKNGPAAMIMPAKPKAGDVYRPENIPGIVFEEVTVKSTDQTVSTAANKIFDAVGTGDWTAAATAHATLREAWTAYRSAGVPDLLDKEASRAIDELTRAVAARLDTALRDIQGAAARKDTAAVARTTPTLLIALTSVQTG